MDRVLMSVRGLRVPLLVVLDAASWLAALTLAGMGWQAVGGADFDWPGLLVVFGIVTLLHMLLGVTVGDLPRRAPVGSTTNAVLVGAVVFTAGFWAAVVNALPFGQWLPFAVPVIATPIALAVQLGGRTGWRLLREHTVARRAASRDAARTLVVGVGSPARQLVRSMLSDPQGRYRPVGFLAHDPDRRGKSACGLPVLGTEQEIAATLSATGARLVVLAAPALETGVVEQVARTALATGVAVKTLPSAAELDRHTASVQDLRDVVAMGQPFKQTTDPGPDRKRRPQS